MDTIKISQLSEKSKVDGNEMIPIQIGDLNYKVSVDTLVDRSREILHAYQQYTYDELKQLKDSKLLLPGEHYLLTDYQCIYKQPVSEELITCDYDGWMIMLLATSEDSFSNDAHVLFTEDSSYIAKGGKSIIECKYVFDNFSEYEWSDSTSKGIIIDLTDSNNNRCNYDFKHIKFRRWALKDVTENDTVGAANQPSCYRCYGTADEPKRHDGRSWVGSGLEIEKEWIKSIFAGTFNSVMWGQSAVGSDYIKFIHKPYTNVEMGYQYVAWDNTLDELSNLNADIPGLAKFIVDQNDYIDCYTFDNNGTDKSNDSLFMHNVIKTPNRTVLPNVTIQCANGCRWNEITGFNTTLMLTQYGGVYMTPYIQRCNFYNIQHSIIIGYFFNQTDFSKLSTKNYICGTLTDFNCQQMDNTVLFGRFTQMHMQESVYNLLFGNGIISYDSQNNIVSVPDGNNWYNDFIQEWFGYNIMAPFQYSVFYPHTNTNTVVMPYNKGVTLMGTIQDNCIERMRWGTILQYGSLQGNYTGELVRCVVNPGAFSSQVAHSSGTSNVYKLEGAVKLPSIVNTDIKCYANSVPQLVANLTNDQKTKLAETGNRKMLFVSNSIPYVKYYSEIFAS